MKGIILAAGSGDTFYPLNKVTSRYLLPVYDKPMIYYPLSILMEAGIKEILIIVSPQDLPMIESLLGDGDSLGIQIVYKEQPSPIGTADAFSIGNSFIGDDSIAMILGDSIFIGSALKKYTYEAIERAGNQNQATIFSCSVKDPQRFGVLTYNNSGKIISIEEKPEKPNSNHCVTGIYFYPNDVIEYVKELKPSNRGEYEITDLNNIYLNKNRLHIEIINKDFLWSNISNIEQLYKVSKRIKTFEEENDSIIGCVEAVAYLNGWINSNEILSYETVDNVDFKYFYNHTAVHSNKYIQHVVSCVKKDLFDH